MTEEKMSETKKSKKQEETYNEYSGLIYEGEDEEEPKEKYTYQLSRQPGTNYHKTKWKTELCHYWEMYGDCKYGNNCSFAHGEDELKRRKLSLNYKTKLCKNFYDQGYCPYGSRCQFLHEQEINGKASEIFSVIPEGHGSYYKIILDFLSTDPDTVISHEVIKRPRLRTFENIIHTTLKEAENSKLQLYEDIKAEREKLFEKNNGKKEENVNNEIKKSIFKLSGDTNYSDATNEE